MAIEFSYPQEAPDRFSGFAPTYDKYRPGPPAVLAPILRSITRVDMPELVVDLGSGTGLSSRYWCDKARTVIGIEPSNDMRKYAESFASPPNIEYRIGDSGQTGLIDNCARIVTCGNSLHWMDPTKTFREVRRILKTGGVFAAFDRYYPPVTGEIEVDAAYKECMESIVTMEKDLDLPTKTSQWSKTRHLARLKESGLFKYAREVFAHDKDFGNADRIVGILLSQGATNSLLKNGLSEKEIGIDKFRTLAEKRLGSNNRVWYWGIKIRVGVI